MLNDTFNVGIIDSGIGGLSVLKAIKAKYGAGNYIYLADNLYMPYGKKSKAWLNNRLQHLFDLLFNTYKVDKIILACNTASCVYSSNDNRVIKLNFDLPYSYLTTPLTAKLCKAKCITATSLANQIEAHILDKTKLNKIVKRYVLKLNLTALDTLVLGCTHYELVKDVFISFCHQTKILNNSDNLISSLNLNPSGEFNVVYITTKQSEAYIQKIKRIMEN